MKIDNSIKGVAGRSPSATSRVANPSAKAPGAPEAAGLQVDISSTAKLGQGGAASTGGAFDAQKVSEIRQAIAEGRFQINPERIADGLVDSVREMLAQRRQT